MKQDDTKKKCDDREVKKGAKRERGGINPFAIVALAALGIPIIYFALLASGVNVLSALKGTSRGADRPAAPQAATRSGNAGSYVRRFGSEMTAALLAENYRKDLAARGYTEISGDKAAPEKKWFKAVSDENSMGLQYCDENGAVTTMRAEDNPDGSGCSGIMTFMNGFIKAEAQDIPDVPAPSRSKLDLSLRSPQDDSRTVRYITELTAEEAAEEMIAAMKSRGWLYETAGNDLAGAGAGGRAMLFHKSGILCYVFVSRRTTGATEGSDVTIARLPSAWPE
jgi:hypothetical protein